MKRGKHVLVFIDRDGTLIYDDKYYLGSQKNWKSKIKFLQGTVQSIKKLRKIPNVKIYMITNQTGIAIEGFPQLTIKRAHEVCKYILKLLEKKGAKLEGYFLCEHASPSYVKDHPEFKFKRELVCNCPCIKPYTGMIKEALHKEGIKPKESKIYVLGDRASDVKTGVNAGGFGILIPFSKEPGQELKFSKIKSKKKFKAKNFAEAAKFILRNN